MTRLRMVAGHIKEGVVGLTVIAGFGWFVLGMLGTGYPGFLPGHNLAWQKTYGCLSDPNDQSSFILGPPPDYEVIYTASCTEEHYVDGVVVYREGQGTVSPGSEISRNAP
jgi:hypothetical protein